MDRARPGDRRGGRAGNHPRRSPPPRQCPSPRRASRGDPGASRGPAEGRARRGRRARRLERDLHDGVQSSCSRSGRKLAAAGWASNSGDERAARLEAAVDENTVLLEEVCGLVHGIYLAISIDGDLRPQPRHCRRRAPPGRDQTGAGTTLRAAVETTAYHIVAVGLENAAVHSSASSVVVDLDEQDGALVVRVHDDGQGGASAGSGRRPC